MSRCTEQLYEEGSAPSPFGRLLAFEVYDGPTSGIVFCRDQDEAFYFRLLSWDERQAQRIFSLSRIPIDLVNELSSDVAAVESPKWPEWWLRGNWADDDRNRILAKLARLSDAAGTVESVVSTKGLLRSIDRARPVATPSEKAAFERLSTRSRRNAEVTDHSFVEWSDFIAKGI